jgi:hypothetical protein
MNRRSLFSLLCAPFLTGHQVRKQRANVAVSYGVFPLKTVKWKTAAVFFIPSGQFKVGSHGSAR